MGNQIVSGSFIATVSRHNSEKDVRHNDLWNEFITKVRHLASNPKYREILLTVDAHEET